MYLADKNKPKPHKNLKTQICYLVKHISDKPLGSFIANTK